MALVNRNADVDAGCKARAEPSDTAPGLTPVADEIALRAGPGPDSVGLGPGPETRRVRRFGRAAAARIVAQRAAEPVRRLISKAFQEIAAEIRHRRAGRQIGIDIGRRRRRRRCWRWPRSNLRLSRRWRSGNRQDDAENDGNG